MRAIQGPFLPTYRGALRRAQPTYVEFVRSLKPAAWFRRGDWTVTGSGISQWNDSSGDARHLLQGTDAARPAGQPDGSVLFNGTSHFLKCAAFTLAQPTWVLMAVKQVSWTANDFICDGDASNTMMVYQNSTTPRFNMSSDNGTTTIGLNANLAVGAVGILSVVFNGASSSSRVNNTTPVTGGVGSNNAGGFTLGSRAAGSSPSNIQVYEVALFPIAPSAAQQDRAIALMARHLGI